MRHYHHISLSLAVMLWAGSALAAPSGEDFYTSLLIQDIPKIQANIAAGADVNYKANGRPMLVWAAQSNNPEIVKILIAAKADVNGADEGLGHTPLMRAVETQSIEVVKILLEAKANPNAESLRGESVLSMAIQTAKPEFVEAIVQAGADVKKISKDGDSPVLAAAQLNLPESAAIIKILAKAGADMNIANAAYSPLSYALMVGNPEITAALLDGGANPNARTPLGRTMLESADSKEIVELLLKAKADPNAPSESGRLPLISAVENGNVEIVAALVKGGADPNKADGNGITPLREANNYSNAEIIEILKQHGAKE